MPEMILQFLPLAALIGLVVFAVLVARGRSARRSEVAQAVGPGFGAIGVDRQMLIEQRVANDGPSTGAAYLLWFFLGPLGGHRWYLGRPGSAVLTILAWLCFIVPGLIWWVIDGFALGGMVRGERDAIRQRLILEAAAMQASARAA